MENIENILTKAAEEHKIPAPTEAWPFIADALRKRKKRRAVWLFLSILGLLMMSGGSYILYNNKEKKANFSKNIPVAQTTSKDTLIIIDKTTPVVNNDSLQIFNEKNIDLKIKKESNPNNTITVNQISNSKNIKKDVAAISYQRKNKNFTLEKNISQTEDEVFFDKNIFRNKTKSNTSVKIKQALVAEDELTTKNKVTNEKEIFEKLVDKNENQQSTTTIVKDTTSIEKNIIAKINIEMPEVKPAKEKPNKKTASKPTKKWHPYIGLSYGAIFISSKNLFKNENKVSNNPIALFATTALQNNLDNSITANYQTGKAITLSYFIKNETKKVQPQFGTTITIGNFNTQAYIASAATFDATSLAIDSSQTGNSFFAAKSTVGSDKLKVKNNFIQVGISFGVNISLFSLKKDNKVLLQTQIIPTYNLYQSIQWYDKSSTRYFTSKKIDNNFNVTQSTSLVLQTSIKNRAILFGPYFNFNYFKLNKSINNISNIYTQRIGAQLQIKLKK
jgi:hypothetical protein